MQKLTSLINLTHKKAQNISLADINDYIQQLSNITLPLSIKLTILKNLLRFYISQLNFLLEKISNSKAEKENFEAKFESLKANLNQENLNESESFNTNNEFVSSSYKSLTNIFSNSTDNNFFEYNFLETENSKKTKKMKFDRKTYTNFNFNDNLRFNKENLRFNNQKLFDNFKEFLKPKKTFKNENLFREFEENDNNYDNFDSYNSFSNSSSKNLYKNFDSQQKNEVINNFFSTDKKIKAKGFYELLILLNFNEVEVLQQKEYGEIIFN